MSTDRKGPRNVILGIIILKCILIMTAAILLSLKKPKSVRDDTTEDPPDQPLGRIVGGIEAVPHSLPWMALIIVTYRGPSTITKICAGTAISNRWVLTAAHCLRDMEINGHLMTFKSAYVVLGIHDYSNRGDKSVFAVIADKKRIFKHPDRIGVANDIALIKLTVPVPADRKNIGYALLPDESSPEPTAGDYCQVAGWGVVDQQQQPVKMSDTLQILPYVQVTSCKSPMHFCIKRPEWVVHAKQSVCVGDSGGPLMCPNGVDRIVIGVLSFTQGVDCNGTHPNYYIRVIPYLDWIKKTMKRNS